MADRSEAKSVKQSFASKYLKLWILMRSIFALLATLHLVILSENKADKKLATLPARVNSNFFSEIENNNFSGIIFYASSPVPAGASQSFAAQCEHNAKYSEFTSCD
jgi:hypothetical protein